MKQKPTVLEQERRSLVIRLAMIAVAAVVVAALVGFGPLSAFPLWLFGAVIGVWAIAELLVVYFGASAAPLPTSLSREHTRDLVLRAYRASSEKRMMYAVLPVLMGFATVIVIGSSWGLLLGVILSAVLARHSYRPALTIVRLRARLDSHGGHSRLDEVLGSPVP